MSVERSLLSPESSTDPCTNEQGCNPETESIPEWSLNVQTYQLLLGGHCTYNAEEQSLVWPPMLLMFAGVESSDKLLDEELNRVIKMLVAEGVQANSVAQTKHVCWEGNASYHLLVLPPSGVSFAAAKAVDSVHGLGFAIFYPSLKDMLDIKNGRLPEFSRRHVEGLKYHGRRRQAWINLGVNLVRDDGICVGLGVCQKYEATDCVNDELLGKSHVGVLVLKVVDSLLPTHWTGSLRRWRTTHVLYNGVSLFECLRQHIYRKYKGEYDDFFYTDGPDSARIARAQGVLRDQSISSVSPSIDICKDLNVNVDQLSSTYSKTCQDAIDDIEKSTFKSDSDGPSLYDGKSFATKFESDESLRRTEIQKIVKDVSKGRNWMERLGTTNSSHLARDVVKRLTVLQKLTGPGSSSALISSMIKGAEDWELSILHVSAEKVKREKPNRMAMADFGSEIEKFILRSRIEQHKELLKDVANIKARHLSTLDAFVLDKFKFVDDIVSRRKKSEGVDQWLSHHIAEATDREKKKREVQVAEIRKEEQKKQEVEVAKVRLEEQKKWEKELANARRKEKKKAEEVVKARMEDRRKFEEDVAKARKEEREKWVEQVAKARTEQKKCEEVSAKVVTELAVARQELEDQKEAMPKCAICFEGLERTVAECGQKRSRDGVVQRRRACFSPCMHSSMCLECSVESWEKFKRCPVCSTPCSLKPQAIFM